MQKKELKNPQRPGFHNLYVLLTHQNLCADNKQLKAILEATVTGIIPDNQKRLFINKLKRRIKALKEIKNLYK